MKKVLVICGPTSSGKTSLALAVATRTKNVSIISADSRQVYKELDIVSGKDIPDNLPNNVHIFGINLFNPNNIANLSEYVNYARKIIDQELSKNRQVIIVGGTGLYLKGITENLEEIFIPNNPELRKTLELLSTDNLKEKLKEVNLEKFNKLNNSDANNPRRLIRYIEISLSKQKPVVYPIPKAEFEWVGLKISTENLKTVIEKRVRSRIDEGAIEEIKLIIQKYPDEKLPIFSALGVSDIISFLKNKISQTELINAWTQSEINYAKRQMTWFKKQPSIIWYDESVDRNQLAYDLAVKINHHD